MKENRLPDMVFAWMLNLNLWVILFMAGIMAASLYGHVHENTALDFLQGVGGMTYVPWKIPAAALLLYGSLLFFLCIRTDHTLLFYMKTGAETGISLLLAGLLPAVPRSPCSDFRSD